uniref:Galectin n=1 Tax=Meloidogyne incognita TaxID=6306 RepID=A0A914LHM7_MELIC
MLLKSFAPLRTLDGDIQLLYHVYYYGKQQKVPVLLYRRESNELKINGTIVCFEALVSAGSEMEYNPSSFTVRLIHDPQLVNNLDVDLVMEIMFYFDPDENTGNDKRNFTFSRSHIVIESYSSKNGIRQNREYYKNPIGAGMPIVVLIIASGSQYIININGGDNLYYQHKVFPHWSTNRVENLNYKVTHFEFNFEFIFLQASHRI